ncbi:hypothetical protein F5Y16DRAFT_383408 [Xylariaceae sp. FL0255]|nr:hypothetical protein F5Y16DRAFT_383408 [Xylariaceae sp. FL0255]
MALMRWLLRILAAMLQGGKVWYLLYKPFSPSLFFFFVSRLPCPLSRRELLHYLDNRIGRWLCSSHADPFWHNFFLDF